MKNLIQIIVALVLFGSLMSCGSDELNNYGSLDKMMEANKASVEMMSVNDLKKAIDNETEYYLIDCRENTEYDSASIPTAIHIPRGLLEFKISSKAHNHRADVIVFCDNGQRSTLAAAVLPQLKYSSVYVLEGGFDAWKREFPGMVELEPEGNGKETNTPPPGAGGCGG